ncbi:hypothetical protein NSQ62_08160 [Solibacillus sp. FSL H8-0523]|uniref:hypothetical protein n=1 Tax=Solibacillus sp. FSL H8-0523 TaxID=2954511 RepID=UPI003101AE2D
MFLGILNDSPIPRWERQLENVDELVLDTIKRKKGVDITKKELHLILEVLYEYRVID